MKFIFDLVFGMIAFIVTMLFLFYNPVGTLIFLAVFFTISITIGVLIFKYQNKK